MHSTTALHVDSTPVLEIFDPDRLPQAPVVSVAMVTYNHERWIAEAIEGVLIQKTDFPIELVIAEDCSTDNTRAIVLDYQKRHPHIIRLLLPEKNLGAHKNACQLLKQCRGTYIALCDGDDYWTSSHKLQRQIDTLQRHPDASFCFHNTSVIFEEAPEKNYLSNPGQLLQVSIEDILHRWFIMTCSIVMKRSHLLPLPPWSIEINSGDWMYQMLLAARGSVQYVDEVMSVYRKHEGSIGITRNFDDADVYTNNIIRLYRHFNRWSGGKYRKAIFKKLSSVYFSAALRHRAHGAYILFVRYGLLHLWVSRPFLQIQSARSIRDLLVPSSFYIALSRTRAYKLCKELFCH